MSNTAPDESQVAAPNGRTPIHTRGYQQELLDESIRRNIIIALDTGAGKTHIAILRILHELARDQTKVCWFLAPNVALCVQQYRVIQEAVPEPVALVHGALQPDQWKNPQLWESIITSHRVVVSTPQVLLNALRHAYVNLFAHISLLCFDEAHHCTGNDPYNRIMVEFYDPMRGMDSPRPKILGLTASPMFGGHDVQRAFEKIEASLDAVIRTAHIFRDELVTYVHRPIFKQVFYAPVHPSGPLFSTNFAVLKFVVDRVLIDEDPFVRNLQNQLTQADLKPGAKFHLDQKLSKTIQSKDTYTQRSLRRFLSTAEAVLHTIGAWAADWFIVEVISRVRSNINPFNNAISTLQNREKKYMLDILDRVITTPISRYKDDISLDCQPKVDKLIDCLLEEKLQSEAVNDTFSGIIFVQRRDCVVALAEVLRHHPRTKDVFQVGCLVGASESAYRRAYLDITHNLERKSEKATLDGFRIGDINLVVATAVGEEGLDIRQCGSVIRWDEPPTMVSFVQSRGRARRKRSSFTLLLEQGGSNDKNIEKWQELEHKMMELYQEAREAERPSILGEEEVDDPRVVLRVPSTGACLTLSSAPEHLNHFCSVIPGASHHTHYRPVYEFDPPEMPEGWHAQENRINPPPQRGPFGCTVRLPRLLPPGLRSFTTPTVHSSKQLAYRHIAFLAYSKLYEEGLLNDNLLPLTSVIEPELEEEVKKMLKDVEHRAGMNEVSTQMDPWAPTGAEEGGWWLSVIEVDELPPIQLLTRSRPDNWAGDAAPIIYRPGVPPSPALLRVATFIPENAEEIATARAYTRKLLFTLFGSRMDWDDMDFCYLVLPIEREEGFEWLEALEEAEDGQACFAPIDALEEFDWPEDVAIVKKFDKIHRMLEYKVDDDFTDEEVEYLQETQLGYDEAVELPLLIVNQLPPRSYFTIPLPPVTDPKALQPKLLTRAHMSVGLLSRNEVDCATLLPTLLRCVAISNTVKSFRETVFAGSDLESIPSAILRTSLLAPVAGERTNYQRLETLGDTVLKFLVAIQLFTQYPLWHEGYLTRRKDHVVNNARLAQKSVSSELYRFIIRDRFIGKKWKPTYFSSKKQPKAKDTAKKGTEQLSVKMLADVIESLIGAAYLHGSFELARQCAARFDSVEQASASKNSDLNILWKTIPDCMDIIFTRIQSIRTPGSSAPVPAQVSHVQEMIGYCFNHPEILLEAITHASHHPIDDFEGISSNERLEFLGDAVLDMVVTDFLYHAPGLKSGKPYSPGHIHLRKSAMVNIHFLGYMCLRQSHEVETLMPTVNSTGSSSAPATFNVSTDRQRIWLYQCLLHSSSVVLDEQRDTFARYERSREALDGVFFPSTADPDEQDPLFPWGELTRLQAPKFLSDMIESILGAVYLDSRGDFGAVRQVLKKFGWQDILERVVNQHMDVLHPVSRVALWAAENKKKEDGKSHHKPDYKIVEEGGDVMCVLSIAGEEIARASEKNQGKSSKNQVRFLAAEMAMRKLKIRGVKSR